MPDITYDVGRVSFVMKGAWNLATSYEKLDAVSYNGSLYIAKQDVPGGTAITNTTYWVLAVEKGDQGETGNGIASIAKTGTAGNVDTYTITYTDGTTTTFTVTNGGVTTVNGRTGDVTGLAEEDGSYPLLNAGTADNLTPYSEDSGATQDIPFINEATGGGNGESVVDTGSYLQFKRKLGNTVGVNQLCDYSKLRTGTYSGITVTKSGNNLIANGTASANAYIQLFNPSKIATISGHKYLAVVPSGTSVSYYDDSSTRQYNNATSSIIFTGSGVDITPSARISSGTTVTNVVISMSLIDLTLWYGSNDSIPSDLLSHPENWGRYYAGSLAYNAGTLESADGTVLTSIGRNVWDEEAESGYVSLVSGSNEANVSYMRSKNYVPIIPNATYYYHNPTDNNIRILFYGADKTYLGQGSAYTSSSKSFTTPSNAYFLRFYWSGSAYNHDITISLYYSGESGYSDYYPYSVLAEVNTGSEVLRSAGSVADEKTPDGTITRRIGVVDMGTLDWTYDTTTLSVPVFKSSYIVGAVTNRAAEFKSSKYAFVGNRTNLENNEKAIARWNAANSAHVAAVRDSAYTDATAFKTAMSGVYLYYELATPTTEQGTAFAENIPCDDFGSMYWTQTKGIPQGNELFYPVDYKASIDTLYNLVNGDMSKIVTEDEYPEAPSSNGTYVLKVTVSGGTKTYAWVAE